MLQLGDYHGVQFEWVQFRKFSFGGKKGATCKYYLIQINQVHIIDTHKQKLKNRENIF